MDECLDGLSKTTGCECIKATTHFANDAMHALVKCVKGDFQLLPHQLKMCKTGPLIPIFVFDKL